MTKAMKPILLLELKYCMVAPKVVTILERNKPIVTESWSLGKKRAMSKMMRLKAMTKMYFVPSYCCFCCSNVCWVCCCSFWQVACFWVICSCSSVDAFSNVEAGYFLLQALFSLLLYESGPVHFGKEKVVA